MEAINHRLQPGVEMLPLHPRPQSQNVNEEQCSDEVSPRPTEPQGGEASGAGNGGSNSDGAGARRRLLYSRLPGFLFAEENYCDKRKFYTGPHEACFQQISQFYGSDVRKLGFSSSREMPRASVTA